jgi:hypothetical protein
MNYLNSEVRCIISGTEHPDPCHVYSRKAYPQHKYEKWNIVPLAHKYHVEQHQFGWSHMINKYPEVDKWLYDNGWELIILNKRKKLIHPVYKD